jgi:hypothetical protein
MLLTCQASPTCQASLLTTSHTTHNDIKAHEFQIKEFIDPHSRRRHYLAFNQIQKNEPVCLWAVVVEAASSIESVKQAALGVGAHGNSVK